MGGMPALAALLAFMAADDFHLSPGGDDARAGTSPAAAWRTLARAGAATLRPGDRLLLEGGKSFEGTIELDAADAGTAEKPVTIGSYGSGRAVVRAGNGIGLLARNCGGITVENLEFEGTSLDEKTDSAGIRFRNDLPGDVKLEAIRVSNVLARGFRTAGIHLLGARGSSGYRGVLLEKVEASGNGIAGVLTGGPGETRGPGIHEDVRVVDGRFHDNEGFPGHKNHSGNGVLVGRARRVLLERCTAWNNGRRCDFKGGGPVGLWVWDCDRAVIQGCESYSNRTGDASIDGGGFDFDGIVTNSVMQYNLSRDNDGAGILVCPYSEECRSEGNVIRYNVSVNDGRAHGYSGIHVYAGGPVKDVDVYHNTVVVSAAPKTPPRAVYVSDSKLVTGLRFRNNVFVTGGGVAHVEVEGEEPAAGSILFQGNAWWAEGKPLSIKWGPKSVGTLEAWRALGQETVEGKPVGVFADPRLGPDRRPGADSPLLDAALDLKKLFALDPGARDQAGAVVPQGAAADLGAFEGTRR